MKIILSHLVPNSGINILYKRTVVYIAIRIIQIFGYNNHVIIVDIDQHATVLLSQEGFYLEYS